MSEKIIEKTIKDYLKEVKAKLPDWIKDRKEHKDIISELEEHIWSKAEELSETGYPTENSVKLAITHMGSPENIAKESKRRGTPKVYITEEMWPLYTKVLMIVFSVIVVVSIIAQIVFNLILGGEPFIEVLSSIFFGIQVSLVISFIIISIVFVVLSMEGYFPEDFKSEKDLAKEKLLVKTAEEKGWPISQKTGKPLKPFIKPIGEIIGGGIVILIGCLFLFQPFPTNLLDLQFLILLRFFGAFIAAEGALNVTRGIIGNRQPSTHQLIHIITIVVKLAPIPLLVILMNQPEIFPILNWDDATETFVNIGIAPEFYGIYMNIIVLIIVGSVLLLAEDMYKIFKIQKYKV
ncbi:MAG: hypothetical protein KGD68_03740 [Candidatus Lokiarchaeota archaeon]|nr:hypothetical protein [Candidatus Lokiarchaeota archaeon]